MTRSILDLTKCNKSNTYLNQGTATLKLSIDFNFCIEKATFPKKLKLADISPVHKKGDRSDKTNYRPVSILPTISKVFERLLKTITI